MYLFLYCILIYKAKMIFQGISHSYSYQSDYNAYLLGPPVEQLDDDTFEPDSKSNSNQQQQQKVKTRRHFFSTKRSTSSITDNLSRQRAMRKPNNIPVLRKWNSSNGLNPEQSTTAPASNTTAPPSNKMSIQRKVQEIITKRRTNCLLYTSPSPRD